MIPYRVKLIIRGGGTEVGETTFVHFSDEYGRNIVCAAA